MAEDAELARAQATMRWGEALLRKTRKRPLPEPAPPEAQAAHAEIMGEVWTKFGEALSRLMIAVHPRSVSLDVTIKGEPGRKRGAATPGDDALIAELFDRRAKGEKPRDLARELAARPECQGRDLAHNEERLWNRYRREVKGRNRA